MLKFWFVAFAASTMALSGCGGEKAGSGEKSSKAAIEKGSPKEVVKLYLSEMDTIATALETVDSEDSAREAAKTLAAAAERLRNAADALDERGGKIGPVLIAANAREFSEVQMRFGTEIQRISTEHPEFFEIISEEIDNMPSITDEE